MLDPYALVLWGTKLQDSLKALYSVPETEYFGVDMQHRMFSITYKTKFVKKKYMRIFSILHFNL